jgi:hypothetical protein
MNQLRVYPSRERRPVALCFILGVQTEGVIMSDGKKKSVEDLIGHALSDKSFRDRLLAAPEATLEAEGYEATPEVIAAIKSTNAEDFNRVANGVEEQIAGRKAAG